VAFVLATASSAIAAAPAQQPQLDCKSGPVTKRFGGSDWLVFACGDGHSLKLIAAPGSKAAPFTFTFRWMKGNGYDLTGMGKENRTFTDPAYAQLSAFDSRNLIQLFAEAAAKVPKR
jgi:hypothetical protein